MDMLSDLLKSLDQMVNDQFESIEFKNFLGVPLTLERGRFYVVQNALYTSNRRDCCWLSEAFRAWVSAAGRRRSQT